MSNETPEQIDRLERLVKLLESGRLSYVEFERLKAEVIGSPASSFPPGVESAAYGNKQTPDPQETTKSVGDDVGTTLPIYRVAFWLGIASAFLGSTIGLLAWATVAVSAYALYSVKVVKGRWMAWTGLALGIVYSFMNAYLNGHLGA